MKVVKDNLHSRKCAIRSFSEPAGDCMASSNSIYISSIGVGQSFCEERASHTSCILYFFLARRRYLSIDPKCPDIDPRSKLAKAPSRIVIELNPRCSMWDNFPIHEKTRRPINDGLGQPIANGIKGVGDESNEGGVSRRSAEKGMADVASSSGL